MLCYGNNNNNLRTKKIDKMMRTMKKNHNKSILSVYMFRKEIEMIKMGVGTFWCIQFFDHSSI